MIALNHAYRLVPPLLIFSLVTNMAILINPLFMMQVLDRVIPSGNQNTLLLLGALAVAALVLQALIELSRDLCLRRLAAWVENSGARQAVAPGCEDPQGLLNQVGTVARFLAGPLAPIALNVPWLPFLVFALFLLHPLFVVLLLTLLVISVANRSVSALLERPRNQLAQFHARGEQQSMNLASQAARNGETATISSNLRLRFAHHQGARLQALRATYKVTAIRDAVSGFLRQSAQILTLALGALLVTRQVLSPGGMIAASLLLGKTYGTAEGTIGQFAAIRAALSDYLALARLPQSAPRNSTDIPDLSGELRAENIVFPRGAGAPPRLDRITFGLQPGECLAIIGSSGSGKTTLLRALAGVTPAPIGSVFFDQSEIRGLPESTLFQVTGYLPQQALLLPGTIAENISCFAPTATDAQIIEAAKRAGVHGLISALPDSYDTDLEHTPHILPAGQKQRIALARAIFNNARYLFLDEPNALLDAEGERALYQTLSRLKAEGATIVMVLHRSGLMGLADKALRLEGGRCIDFGPRAEVLNRMNAGRRQIVLPRLASSMEDLSDWIADQFSRADDAALRNKAQMIGTEMFIAACNTAGEDCAPQVTFNFAFKGDHHCELSLLDAAQSGAAKALNRVETLLEASPDISEPLTQQEQNLVNLIHMSDHVDIRTVQGNTVFRVALSEVPDETPEPMVRAG